MSVVTPAVRSYGLLLWWQYLRYRRVLATIVVVQVALAVGIVYGFSFLIPDLDRKSALFLATGAPTFTLLIMGLQVVPQEVSQGKLTGRFDYLSSLPIPRLATFASDVTFWLFAQLPGTGLALAVAAARFGFALHPNWAVVPTVLLVALSGSAVGYSLSMAVRPELAQQVSQFVSIGILLFSPIDYPLERLPPWLRHMHRVLPVSYMADLVRWSLAHAAAPSVPLAFAVVGAWCAGGLVLSYVLAVRRH